MQQKQHDYALLLRECWVDKDNRNNGKSVRHKNKMTCSKCTGSKHHSDNCTSDRGTAKAEEFLCYNCNGWGHEQRECTSPGSDAYESTSSEEEFGPDDL